MFIETRTRDFPEPGTWSAVAGSDRGIARYLGITESLDRKRETITPAVPPLDNDPATAAAKAA